MVISFKKLVSGNSCLSRLSLNAFNGFHKVGSQCSRQNLQYLKIDFKIDVAIEVKDRWLILMPITDATLITNRLVSTI